MSLRKAIPVVTLLFAPSIAFGASGEANTIKGSITMAGKSTPLTNVMVLRQKPGFGGAESLLIVVSDAPLSPADAKDAPKLRKMALAGKFHAMLIPVENRGARGWVPGRNDVYHDAFKSADSPGENSLQGTQSFDVTAADAKSVSGRLHMQLGPHTFEKGGSFDYDVTFSAQIQ